MPHLSRFIWSLFWYKIEINRVHVMFLPDFVWTFVRWDSSFTSKCNQNSSEKWESQPCSQMVYNIRVSFSPLFSNFLCQPLEHVFATWSHSTGCCQHKWDKRSLLCLQNSLFILSLFSCLVLLVYVSYRLEYIWGTIGVSYPYVTESPLKRTKIPLADTSSLAPAWTFVCGWKLVLLQSWRGVSICTSKND